MKKIYLIIILIFWVTYSVISQVPDAFKYQAVVRNSSGEILSNQDIGVRVKILADGASGTTLYSESHSVTTSELGVVSLNVGTGTVISGAFSAINWLSGDKYLSIAVDESGGTSYTEMGAVQLMSVPYALYSNYAENLGDKNIYSAGSDTLFVVKDTNGNVVFAVFPDGAAVYVNESVKGKVGGFAVSGRSPSKLTEEEYLVVTPDSTRVYFKDTTAVKSKVGGFAVSGRSPSKGSISSLMNLRKENYFIGHEAGRFNTEGQFNTFMGYKSGYSNVLGNRNTFIGYYSGYSNYDGNSNIFIGDSSGYFNDYGYYNIFVGNNSGTSNISGYQNVFIGNESGYSNINGRWNVFIGQRTGRNNTTGERNVIIGATSGYFNTTGLQNVFVGNWCGYYNTTGSNNIFLGNRSGWNNTEGSHNVFVGSFSGFTNTIAGNNIFVGNASGYSNETGAENIFIGRESGYMNVSGDLNTCIGFQSGYSLDTANYNTFLGFWSGLNNENGALNTYVGAQAGENAVDGNLNVIVGAYAGSEGTIGDFNTFIGMRAGSKNAGNNNTFLGGFAGYNNSVGNFNVFIGQASGENNNGSRNVFIGNGTGYNNDGDYNVFIGNDAGNSITGSNKLVIHNWDADSSQALIYGEFDHEYLRFNAYIDGLKFLNSWNVDSNYISDGNYMSFAHAGVSEDFIGYRSNTFYFLDAPGGGDVVDPSVIIGGDVGIGVLVPSEKLDVNGNINITGSYLVNGAKGNFADFVFEEGYKLESIEEHSEFMWKNKHLPALTSAKDLRSSGSYDISRRREQILEELEKAHIYIDQLNRQIKELKESNDKLSERLDQIERKLAND